MYKFTITINDPEVKKNGMMIRRAGARRWISPNNKYQAWEKIAVVDLLEWKHRLPQSFASLLPVSDYTYIYITPFFKDKRHPDLLNIGQGPQDAMEKAGIFTNDKLMVPRFNMPVFSKEIGKKLEIEFDLEMEWSNGQGV